MDVLSDARHQVGLEKEGLVFDCKHGRIGLINQTLAANIFCVDNEKLIIFIRLLKSCLFERIDKLVKSVVSSISIVSILGLFIAFFLIH